MRYRRGRRLGAALLLLVTLAACDGSAEDGGPTPSERPPATGRVETRHDFSVRPLLSQHTPYGLGPIALQGDEVAVPAGADGDWDRVAVLGPGAKPLRIVAHSQFARGLINWVAVSGDWVAWVDQSHAQSDSDPDVLWRIRAIDLRTHEKRLLASNGHAADPFVPQVQGAPAGLFWTQAEQDRMARERFWVPGARAPTDLVRHAEMTPGSETFADGAVVFLGPSALPHHGHTTGGDCWRVSLADHEVQPLTRTGLAMGCAAAGDAVTWTQHLDPDARSLPADGVLDDPYEVLVRPLAGGPSRLLHRGYLAMGYPRSGATFTAWPTVRGSLMVRSLTGAAHLVVPRSAGGGTFFRAGGESLAFVRSRSAGDVLSVVRVRSR